MRSSFAFAACTLFCAGVSAQLSSGGQVAAMVAEHKAQQTVLTKVEPFKMAAMPSLRDALVGVVVDDAVFMSVSGATLAELLTQRPDHITLAVPTDHGEIDLELVRANIYSDGFSMVMASTDAPVSHEAGLHYRGIIAGHPGTLAAISIFPEEVMGFVSDDEGNHVLGRLAGGTNEHIYYAESDLVVPPVMECATPEDGGTYTADQLKGHGSLKSVNCVDLYWEVNYDVFQDKGSVVNTSNYITGLFNQQATLYANDGISVLLSQLYIWDVASPYTATSTSALLGQFQSNRNSFNGDLANLLGYAGGGGVAAGFSGLCNGNLDNSMCYSGISGSYNTVPTYSWTAMVVTHEQGHLLGSRHTHACVWNGNSTAIDGCGPAAGYGYEGSCSGAPIPGTGGTIMSYCHLNAVGINFNNGFGTQPRTVILNNVESAACVANCTGATCGVPANLSATFVANNSATVNWGAVAGATSYDLQWKPASSGTWTDVGGIIGLSYPLTGLTVNITYNFRVRAVCGVGPSAYSTTSSFTTQACSLVTLRMVLDRWGTEITWSITSPGGGTTYASGGPYTDQASNGSYPQPDVNICLPDGCYELRVADSFGDGICCASGYGTFNLSDAAGNGLASGGTFTFLSVNSFCLPATCLNTLPFSTNFDANPGGFTQDAGDDFDWSRFNAVTPTSNTGPDVDHTSGTGYYMYIEASAPNNPNKVARLLSPCFDMSGYSNVTLSFWRHMYGATIGSLNLDVQMNGGTWNTAWTLSGNQGNSWVQATVDLTPYISSNTRLRFRGITGSGTTGDIAIDDVSLTGTSGVKVNAKVWLEGPFVAGSPSLMNDNLRGLAGFPTTEPYTGLSFTNAAGGGGETTNAGVLAVSGSNAIVDWVRIELRNSGDPASIVATRQCLLQRDGDVVSAADGTSPVTLNVGPGSYYVAVRHRNHLGAMTSAAVSLSASPATIDFRSASTLTYGTEARKTIGSEMTLWAGNTFRDTPLPFKLIYTNSDNDREPILTAIGGVVPTNTVTGYFVADVNLDGVVKYTNAGNDREYILQNIGGTVPTNTRTEQLP